MFAPHRPLLLVAATTLNFSDDTVVELERSLWQLPQDAKFLTKRGWVPAPLVSVPLGERQQRLALILQRLWPTAIAPHRFELWICEKGGLKHLQRLKVNEAHRI
jgi:hypothetical protein